MALARVKTWVSAEVLFASDLNAEYNNILNNPISLISPITANVNWNGFDSTALGELGFNDAAADPTAVGRLRRNGNTLTYRLQDGRTNTVVRPFAVQADTTGTPAASIGVGMRFDAESADEQPSNFGALDFVATDVTAGSEDTDLVVRLRTAGAALGEAFRITSVGYAPFMLSRIQRNSATQIQLNVGVIPLRVSGVWLLRRVTAAVTIANTGLAASTTYNVYAYDNAGTTTLELSATGHSTDTDFGVEIKTGDATRTLVGAIRTEGSTPGQFVDSATQRFVISWFNRWTLGLTNVFTANRTTASATYVEMNTEIRIEFLTWSTEAVIVSSSGVLASSAATNLAAVSIGFDGTTAEDVFGGASLTSNSAYGLTVAKSGLSEGYHYATLLGRHFNSDTLTIYVQSNAAGSRTSLHGQIRG